MVTDKALLTAATSILTLESRHYSLLNVFSGGSYASQPFDIALAPPLSLVLLVAAFKEAQEDLVNLTSSLLN